jgi:hypothetical protein
MGERLGTLLAQFHLTTMATELLPRFAQAGQQETLPLLLEVCELEAAERQARRIARLRAAAKLPPGKTSTAPDFFGHRFGLTKPGVLKGSEMSQEKDGREEEAGMEAAERTSEELPERWSARAKTEIVLRLLKGEEVGTVSREMQVPVHELERWRRIFLEGGTNGFKRRDTPGAERELKRVQAKVGELTMKLEIVEWFLEKKGYGEELRKLKRSGEL